MKIQFELDSFYTATDLIAKLLEGDGAGSGLDADLLDGQHGAYYLPAGTYTAADILAKLLTVDGHGTGLDADKLDGTELAKILALGSTIPGSVNLNSYTSTGLFHQPSTANAASGSNYPVALAGMLEVIADGSIIYQKYTVYDSSHNVYVRTYYSGSWFTWTRVLDSTDLTTINANLALKLNAATYTAADILAKLITVDGSGSGLDADTIDGVQYSAIESAINAKLNASVYTAADVLAKIKSLDGSTSGLDADLLDGQEGDYYLQAGSYTAADILAKLLTVDGAGTGLDADKVDGAHAVTVATASSIPKTNAAGTLDPSFIASKTVQHIETKTIAEGSPQSSVTFSGLNGNSDGFYYIEYALHNSNNMDYIYINPNAITTAGTGLFNWNGTWNGALTGMSTDAYGRFCLCRVNGRGVHKGIALLDAVADADLGGRSLYERGISRDANEGGGYMHRNCTSYWEQTSTNITSLVFAASANNFWGRIRLSKLC